MALSAKEIIDSCSDELRCATRKTAPLYGPPDFKGQRFAALAYKVYDGDTCWAALKMADGSLRTFKVRVMGNDTPEMKGGRTPLEKKLAIIARDRARELIDQKMVVLRCEGYDQYKRLLAFVELEDGRDLAQLLIEENLAFAYNGTKKKRNWIELAEARGMELEEGDWWPEDEEKA